MANFNLDDYEPVDARLKKAFIDHPDMEVTAQILSAMESINDYCVIKAVISWSYKDRLRTFTGIAHERHDAGYVNKTSHVENCETSAIGRALANAGYSGDKRASREEMDKVNRSQASKNQEEHAETKEQRARKKAENLLTSIAAEYGEDARRDYEENLLDAKTYDEVVVIGKEMTADLDKARGKPKGKQALAETLGNLEKEAEQQEIF